MTIEEFIEKCQKRPLPNNPVARVKVLARELAEGAILELWYAKIGSKTFKTSESQENWDKRMEGLYNRIGITENYISWWHLFYGSSLGDQFVEHLLRYLASRWEREKAPNPHILESQGFISTTNGLFFTEKAFKLLEESDPATIFISYKRSESSAFALLLEDRLTQANLSPFLDKQLQAGDDWHAELESKIANSDFMTLILSNKTLESSVTIKEIGWAIQYKKTLIPIWHNGFVFKAEEWTQLPAEISYALGNTHTIRVIEENPLTYDTALRELLNRFGISG